MVEEPREGREVLGRMPPAARSLEMEWVVTETSSMAAESKWLLLLLGGFGGFDGLAGGPTVMESGAASAVLCRRWRWRRARCSARQERRRLMRRRRVVASPEKPARYHDCVVLLLGEGGEM